MVEAGLTRSDMVAAPDKRSTDLSCMDIHWDRPGERLVAFGSILDRFAQRAPIDDVLRHRLSALIPLWQSCPVACYGLRRVVG